MYWDSENQTTVSYSDEPWEGYLGWIDRDCSCCNGLVWGGGWGFHTTGEPDECDLCAGIGHFAVHMKSGVIAQWPGGPFLGRGDPVSEESNP